MKTQASVTFCIGRDVVLSRKSKAELFCKRLAWVASFLRHWQIFDTKSLLDEFPVDWNTKY